jgi:Spy/CpxP family protein refolding chaperone
MVMKTKVLVLAVCMGFTTLLMAQPKENGSKNSMRGPQHETRINEQRGPGNGLDLTDAQKEAFKQSKLVVQKQLQPLQNELGEAEAHQKTLMTAEKPDITAINKNIEKMGSLKTEMAKIQAKNRLDMRAQLTEEQRLKFDLSRDHMREGIGPKGMKHDRVMHEEHSFN